MGKKTIGFWFPRLAAEQINRRQAPKMIRRKKKKKGGVQRSETFGVLG